MSLAIILLGVLFLWIVVKHYYFSFRFPPGLPRLPVVGTVPFLRGETGSRVLLSSVNLIPKYGDIIGYFMGPNIKMIFVQDFNKGKELAMSEVFMGRHNGAYAQLRGHNNLPTGVASTDGNIWKHLRRFSLATLKEFGFGKKSIGTIIEEEAQSLVLEDFLMKYGNKGDGDMLVESPFNVSIFNVIWRIVAGKRYERDDPKIRNQVALLTEVFKTAFMEMAVPAFLYRLVPSLTGLDTKKKHVDSLKKIMNDEIECHKINLVPGEPKDFIDVYLEAMKDDPALTIHHLNGICMDFFEAGGETVGSTLSWLLMYLALFPEVQSKCREEIDRVVGSRNVTLDDKPEMPYVEATIMEVQRLSCVAPASIPHEAMTDSYFHGYFIPKGTMLLYNIFWFHMDPKYWGDPESFSPERFIDQKTGTLIRKDQFVPYGFGKRVCMGESLAKAELFLFTAILIKHVIVEKPEDNPIPDPQNDIAGFTRSPQPFHIKIKRRY